MAVELEGGSPWTSTSFLMPLFPRGLIQWDYARLLKNKNLLSWSPQPCSLLSASWTPSSHGNCSQVSAFNIHSFNQPFPVCNYEVHQSTFSIIGSGSCHPYLLGAPWIAYAWLCCSSSRYWDCWSLPRGPGPTNEMLLLLAGSLIHLFLLIKWAIADTY